MNSFMTELPYAIALVVVAVIFLAIFKPNLSRLIDRVKKIGKIEAPPIQAPEPTPTAPPKQSLQEDSSTIREFSELIEENLDRLGLPRSADNARYTELLRLASYAQMNAIFERAASQIFGSQLQLLKFLRANGNTASKEHAASLYNKARNEYAGAYIDRDYDVWLDFLVNFGFVTRIFDSITLTRRGIDFLIFFPATGRVEPDKL